MLRSEEGKSSGRGLIATIKFSIQITAKHRTHLHSACSLVLKSEKYSHTSFLTSISLASFVACSTANCFFSSQISFTRACKTKLLVISPIKYTRLIKNTRRCSYQWYCSVGLCTGLQKFDLNGFSGVNSIHSNISTQIWQLIKPIIICRFQSTHQGYE